MMRNKNQFLRNWKHLSNVFLYVIKTDKVEIITKKGNLHCNGVNGKANHPEFFKYSNTVH